MKGMKPDLVLNNAEQTLHRERSVVIVTIGYSDCIRRHVREDIMVRGFASASKMFRASPFVVYFS